MASIRILQVVGSPTSAFHVELSELYARGCVDALANLTGHSFCFAHVSPCGSWRFPQTLSPFDIAKAEPSTFAQAIERIAHLAVDLALPQMFCERGMTEYRALLDLLQIPYLGNKPLQMGITADKSMTKAIVSAAGVSVPQAQLLRRGEAPHASPPYVVKPNSSDNSEGVTLVKTREALGDALDLALRFSDAALIEDYVELGREVRCGIVQRGSELVCLPLEEYRVDTASRPVRTAANKLRRSTSGDLGLSAKTADESWIVAPGDPIEARVWAEARHSYIALGLRQYGLFDFRIDPTGKPWFLEAGPYCSFSPQSVLVTMMAATGVPLARFFSASVEALLGTAP